MARRAAVPPRTIFTKDVSKISGAHRKASGKMKKVFVEGPILSASV
jgi:hypothetical protein